MKKISVLGGAFSGKSTLSVGIAKRLKYPILHMDSLSLAPKDRSNHTLKQQNQIKYKNFIEQNDKWVIDGVYSWFDLNGRLLSADTMIVLLRPKIVRLIAYIKTCILHKNRIAQADYQSGFHWHMVKWIMCEEKMSSKDIDKLLAQFKHANIIKLRSFKEQKAFLKQL